MMWLHPEVIYNDWVANYYNSADNTGPVYATKNDWENARKHVWKYSYDDSFTVAYQEAMENY